MSGKHARLSPSQSTIWINCPGSIELCKDLPDTTSKFASEGTAAHDLAEQCLTNNESPFDRIGEYIVADKIAFEITEEMASGVEVYLDAVRSLAESVGQPIQAEQSVSLEYLTGTKDLGGTVDALFADIVFENTLYVYDLKFGKGIEVDVVFNYQLMIYALGALGRYLNEDGKCALEYVEMGIVQPRKPHVDGPVRTYVMTVEDLQEWGDNTLVPAAEATYKADATFCSGAHCKWCKANRNLCCPVLNESVYVLAEQAFPEVVQASLPEPKEMDVDTLSKVLEGGKVIESWYKNVKAHALDRALAGDKIPGLKLVKGFGDRAWVAEETVVKTMGKKYPGIMTDPTPKLKSVAQVEKALKKEHGLKPKNIDELIKHLYEKPEKGLKLVAESNKAEAVDPLLSSAEQAKSSFDVPLESTEDFLN